MMKYRGFTLIELMVTLAIAAILLTVGVPSFSDTIKNNRLIAQTNKFVGSVALARSEGVKTAQTVNMCPANATYTACSGNTNWSTGWIVWIDLNGNATIQANEIRQIVEALPASITFTAGLSAYTFTPQGAAGGTDTLVMCDDRTGETGRRIQIRVTGRTYVDNPNPACA